MGSFFLWKKQGCEENLLEGSNSAHILDNSILY